MHIDDISVTITNQLPTWPGDPNVELGRVSKIEEGANANVSQICMGVHTGTHVDAPFHFLPGGSTVESMPLDVLVGPVLVVRIPDEVEVINSEALKQAHIPANTERLLFKTRNSAFWAEKEQHFHTDFIGIDQDGADYLVNLGIKLVGIDYLSISPYHHSRPTHEALLSAKMVIIEGLNLARIEPGSYTLYCLPLKLGGSDGAPARAILVSD